MNLSIARWEKGFVVRVIGRGTQQESPAFREAVTQCLKQSPKSNVVVDLTDCHYIDSTFIGAMIWLHKHVGEFQPDRLQFCADTSKCHQLFVHGLVDRVLNIIPTCPLITSDPVDLENFEAVSDEDRRVRFVR